MKSFRLILPLVLIVTFLIAPFAIPQGSLTPAGAPAPTMKTLDQIASTGIPLNTANAPGSASAQFVISNSGSYYLTGNLVGVSGKNGIQINSFNVTLDLNGFTLLGAFGLTGITDGGSNHANLTIRNGTINGWAAGGVDISHSINSNVSGLVVAEITGAGVSLGSGCVARDLAADNNTGDNIVAGKRGNFSHCSAVGSINGNGFNVGDDCTLTDCAANSNKLTGILATAGCTVSHSTAAENLGEGIHTGSGGVLHACTGYRNTGYGLDCGNGSTLTDCAANLNGSPATFSAIFTGTGCTLSTCTASGNTAQYGIAANAGSTIIHCTASNNTSAQTISAGILAASCVVKDCNASANETTNPTPSNTTGMGFYCNGSDAIFENCAAGGNRGDGINVVTGCLVRGNLCTRNSGAGVHATGTANRIEGNQLVSNVSGILVDATVNLVFGNTARGNTPNYSIAAGNRVATIVTPTPTAVAINGNTGGSAFSTDAFSNIAY